MSHFDWKLLRRKKVLQLHHTVPEHTFRVLLFRTLDPSHAPSPLLDLSTRGKISHGGGFPRISGAQDRPGKRTVRFVSMISFLWMIAAISS